MNYELHYNVLIQKGRNRTLVGYTEEHHVMPKCMGGTDNAENLVKLTPEEHFVAHQLLAKMYPTVKGLIYSLARLSGGKSTLRTNKLYGWIKRRLAKQRSKEMKGHTIWVGRKHSQETKDKIKEFNLANSQSKGLVRSDETKLKISITKKNAPKLTCPHCDRSMSEYYINKYHLNFCKMINTDNILP
jgi:hypothetical protein